VERQWIPEWAIQVGIRCHFAAISLRDASQFLDELGVDRSHVAIHEWLYGAVDPETSEILHVSLFPTANKQTTRWFLDELHRRYQLNNVLFLVDDADYLGSVLAEDGYRFQIQSHGNRNAIERNFGR
jgi:transposase-like protein